LFLEPFYTVVDELLQKVKEKDHNLRHHVQCNEEYKKKNDLSPFYNVAAGGNAPSNAHAAAALEFSNA
jgi:hypothetical protein